MIRIPLEYPVLTLNIYTRHNPTTEIRWYDDELTLIRYFLNFYAFDMQSGQVHFYNTRTQKRTCRDPRGSPEPVSSRTMSLDLELNLPFDFFAGHAEHELKSPPPNSTDSSSKSKPIPSRSLSWVSLEADDQQEMIAAVCMRCHMLVMLCKSSPACPNCKFMNPTDQSLSIKLDSPLLWGLTYQMNLKSSKCFDQDVLAFQ